MDDLEQFRPVFLGYLEKKGIYDESDKELIIEQIYSESGEIFVDGNLLAETINLLLFRDIVRGLWNENVNTIQALYQLVNSVDLYLALKGYLFETVDSNKISTNFQKIAKKIDTLEDEDAFEAFKDYLKADKTWIPVQKEYKDVYVFLLINAVSLLYTDKSYETV